MWLCTCATVVTCASLRDEERNVVNSKLEVVDCLYNVVTLLNVEVVELLNFVFSTVERDRV